MSAALAAWGTMASSPDLLASEHTCSRLPSTCTWTLIGLQQEQAEAKPAAATPEELLGAAERGDLEAVRRALAAGVDVNSCDRVRAACACVRIG